MAAGGGSCSACDQYTETTPSAGGSKTPSNKKPKITTPSVTTRTALESVKKPARRRTLKKIATDPNYGASIGKLPVATVKTPSASVSHSLGAVIKSPGSGSTGRLGALLAVIVFSTFGIGVNAIRRQRT
jgi:hypothetical protein